MGKVDVQQHEGKLMCMRIVIGQIAVASVALGDRTSKYSLSDREPGSPDHVHNPRTFGLGHVRGRDGRGIL